MRGFARLDPRQGLVRGPLLKIALATVASCLVGGALAGCTPTSGIARTMDAGVPTPSSTPTTVTTARPTPSPSTGASSAPGASATPPAWLLAGSTVPPEGFPIATNGPLVSGWRMTSSLLPAVVPGESLVAAMAALPDLLVVVGTTSYRLGEGRSGSFGGVVWTSRDGDRWQRTDSQSFPGCQLRTAIASATAVWVGGDCDGIPAVWASPDGVEWTKATLPASGDAAVRRITADAGGRFVAFGTVGRGAVAWYSSDGRVWHAATLPAMTGDSTILAGTSWNEGWLALVNNGDQVWPLASADGSTWTRGPKPLLVPTSTDRTAPYAADVTDLNGTLYAVGVATGGFGPAAATWDSTDGVTWRLVMPQSFGKDSSIMAIEATGDGAIGVGTGGVWSYTAAMSWRPAPGGAGGYDYIGYTWAGPMFQDIATFHGRLFAVAQFGEGPIAADMGVPANPTVWEIVCPLG